MAEENTVRERLDRYELLELVEQDMAGQLYRATGEGGRKVMVKVLAPSVSQNPAFGRYFYDKWAERRTLVEHPNVLEVLDVGRKGELYYVAVEDAGGQRLTEKLREAPLETDEALNLVRQTAEGLRAAHRREVLHGHLKPSDIVLTADPAGRPLVKVAFIDLGVAPADSVVSVFGEVAGAPKYMAPEVIRGRSPDAQADVFALGVIAYEIFTGKEPFPSEHQLGYLFANCESEAKPADQVNEGVPHEVALVIARMLAKDPAQRYRSMQRVIDDLDRCAQSVKTGHAEMVPFGTDSAFARTYELPQTKASSVRGRLPAGPLLAAAVVVAGLVGLAGYFIGRGSPETPQGRVERPSQGAPFVRPAAPVAGHEEPGPPEPAEATEQTPAQRELAARKAFEQAQTDWQRYSQSNDYEMGLTAFRDVASKYADTAYAAQSQEQMARIYTEWARASAAAGNHEEAVERYHKALEVAPEGSSFADLARRVLPSAMANLAESARVRGQYDRALSLYDEIASQYPGTKEAALVQTRKPETQLSQAFVLWKDRQEFDTALSILMQVVKAYPETKWAGQAKQAMPTLYLDTIRLKLSQGKLLDARKQLQELVEAYPGHQAAQEAAEMDAELLFRLLEQARAAGEDADAAGAYGELLRRYPSSQWSVKAAGLALKLPAAQGTAYDERTAQNQLKEALRRREALDFKNAIGTLKGLLRYARPDSAVAAEALAKLPAWMYESALYAHGQGAAEECVAMLAEVSAQFPQTAWDARAVQTRQRLSTPPEGMVYVPEGLFQVGTDMSELVALLKPYGPTAWAQDDEAARAFAEASELVNETPRHVASTGAFFVSRTEVSNEDYKQFIDATGYPAPSHWQAGTYPQGEGKLPVVNVTAQDAAAYAKWRGGRLPTEEEWEKAARGTAGRRFPWGDVYGEKSAHHLQPGDAGPMAVGSFKSWVSPYGCLDMIGNVREWTTSRLAAYPGTSWVGPGADDRRVVCRGGAWFQEELIPIPVRCASRYSMEPARADKATGFRWVMDAQEPEPAAAPRTGPAP